MILRLDVGVPARYDVAEESRDDALEVGCELEDDERLMDVCTHESPAGAGSALWWSAQLCVLHCGRRGSLQCNRCRGGEERSW